MAVEQKYYPLEGGLDQISAAIAVPPGAVIASENYEPAPRGYQRIDGFERLDGRPKPSAASYWILDFDAGTAAISAGDIITGATSAATGEALVDAVIESGSYVGTDAAGYNVMVNVVGTFQNDENLQVSAATKSVANGVVSEKGADTDALDSTYLQDAIETTRADILVVPGSGNMRGVWTYGGADYAFRDNAGATAVDMYKATTAGWALQDLGETMYFTSGGVATLVEGNTITGASSAKTAVVKRIIVTSGTWAGGDAAGRLILYSVTGAFTPGEGLEVGAVNIATCTADAVVNTLVAGGKFDFVNGNFTGSTGTRRMYGVDGVSLGFEWDGAVFVPIITGMTTDKPKHVFIHKNHLFYSFTGGSVQHSGIGTPYSWTLITGALEIGIGQEITAFSGNATKTLTIFGRNLVCVLYGTDKDSWELVTLTDEAGAVEWTAQLLGTAVYLDDQGLRTLDTTQAFGDFKLGTLTQNVDPAFKSKKKASVTATASIRVRAKDSYRIFWSDSSVMTVYFGHKKPEIMFQNLGKVVHCACSGEDSNGNEILLFGSTDGYIYQLDAGTSLDGSELVSYVRLPFNHVGSPTRHKRWHKATLELDAAANTTLTIAGDFGYADPDQPSMGELDFSVKGSGGFWNEANWNEFYWSSQAEGLAEAHIDGEGTNISLLIRSAATYEAAHTLHGLTLHYSERRLKR